MPLLARRHHTNGGAATCSGTGTTVHFMTSARPPRRWVGKDAFWSPRVYSLLRRVDMAMAVLALVMALVSAVVIRSWLLALLFLMMAAVAAWQPGTRRR